jgi:hypothetical protein
MPKTFPGAKVKQIIGFTGFNFQTDTYYRFEALSYTQLKDLIEIKAASLKDAQNEGPTIHKLVDWVEEKGYQKEVTFFGYVIFPPRVDARVSIDGLYLALPGLESVYEIYQWLVLTALADSQKTMLGDLPVVEGAMAAKGLDLATLCALREVLIALPNASEEDLEIREDTTVLRLWWD